ncbi:MAG: hypothetical protein Q8869_02680 [Candidatus Phytoplasma australasiaticum]|nr:hypothetical protein [Candidatus Phytoplasma australasiaticum]
MLLFFNNSIKYGYILHLLLVIMVIIIVIINFFRKRKIFNKCFLIIKEINKTNEFLYQMTQEQKQQQKQQYSKWISIINDKYSEIQKYLLSHVNNPLEILAKIIILSESPILCNVFDHIILKNFGFLIFFIVPFIFEIINHFVITKYNQKFQESYSVIKQVNEDIKNQQNSQNIK